MKMKTTKCLVALALVVVMLSASDERVVEFAAMQVALALVVVMLSACGGTDNQKWSSTTPPVWVAQNDAR